MPIGGPIRRLTRRAPAAMVTGPLMVAYAGLVVGLGLPVIVGTGTVLYYLDRALGLTGVVQVAYFALGVLVVMVEYTFLHAFFEGVGDRLFGEIPEEPWRK